VMPTNTRTTPNTSASSLGLRERLPAEWAIRMVAGPYAVGSGGAIGRTAPAYRSLDSPPRNRLRVGAGRRTPQYPGPPRWRDVGRGTRP
jgi:hypothetical protein